MAVSPEGALPGFSYTTIALAAIPLLMVAISKLISPKFSPQEPPPLWPTIPIIGHLIGILREPTSFYPKL